MTDSSEETELEKLMYQAIISMGGGGKSVSHVAARVAHEFYAEKIELFRRLAKGSIHVAETKAEQRIAELEAQQHTKWSTVKRVRELEAALQNSPNYIRAMEHTDCAWGEDWHEGCCLDKGYFYVQLIRQSEGEPLNQESKEE